ncbi:MAG: hypothetical protein QM751_04360 [Paludibacteraceae bacterium]
MIQQKITKNKNKTEQAQQILPIELGKWANSSLCASIFYKTIKKNNYKHMKRKILLLLWISGVVCVGAQNTLSLDDCRENGIGVQQESENLTRIA